MVTESLVLGGDLGGTSTRILVAGTDGRECGRGTAGAGNPVSNPAGAAEALGDALRMALTGVDPGRVKASVIGVAGGSALRTPPVAARFGQVWAAARLTCDPGYAPDLEVAFAAGTPEPDGSVLIAGTGATAGAVIDHRLARTADGHGWLLGDDGSGFWLGREAVRAALHTLDAGEPPGRLVGSVLRELDADGTGDEVASAPGRRGTDRRATGSSRRCTRVPASSCRCWPRWSAPPTGTATRRRGRSSNAPRPRCWPPSAGSGTRPRPRRSSSPGA